MPDHEMEKFLEGAIGVVESTNYERMCLWREYTEIRKIEWKDNLSGHGVTVGHVNKNPVCMTLWNAVIGGHKVLFFEATSQLVDHRMIDKWFQDHMPKSGWQPSDAYPNRSDAMNFSNIFRYVEDRHPLRKSA
jgi:hypothetical protein